MYMTDNLKRIYGRLWSEPDENEQHILELQEECDCLEQQLIKAAKNLPGEIEKLIERYIYSREELELYSVTKAYKAGQKSDREREYY